MKPVTGSREIIGPAGTLTDESPLRTRNPGVCPTLPAKDLHAGGAGASACQPISSQHPGYVSSAFQSSAARRLVDSGKVFHPFQDTPKQFLMEMFILCQILSGRSRSRPS